MAPITVSIAEFCRLSALSRMSVWRLTKSGDLKAVNVGAKRLILLQSYHDFLARRAAEEAA
jgi:hypothetical protein